MKRQMCIRDRFFIFWKREWVAGKCKGLCLELYGTKCRRSPVSYTHLDVYKRQFIGFDAGWGDVVCCFHIAVAMIYSNDFGVSEFSHKKYLRFRID